MSGDRFTQAVGRPDFRPNFVTMSTTHEREEWVRSVRAFIATGNTEKAFTYLQRQALDSRTYKNLAMLQAEFNQLKEEERKGTLIMEEKQVRRNRIHDKLLDLVEVGPPAGVASPGGNKLMWTFVSLGVVLVAAFIWYNMRSSTQKCPAYPDGFNNRVMVLPFTQIGGSSDAINRPDIALRDQINSLTDRRELSAIARLGTADSEDITIFDAPAVAGKCDANLLIWGSYAHSSSDSLILNLKYAFTDFPDLGYSGVLVPLKDVTELHSGSMNKDLQDALMTFCGLIAWNDGNKALASTWLNKVKAKDQVDQLALEKLAN